MVLPLNQYAEHCQSLRFEVSRHVLSAALCACKGRLTVSQSTTIGIRMVTLISN